MKRLFLILFIIILAGSHADRIWAGQRDSLCISLLTCSPGDIAYTMYGHSAIRVHNLTTNKDVVFNYGMFNFDEDNFVYKFVKGETDYILGAEPADYFFGRYREKGMGIEEQILNFTQDEYWQLYDILWVNIQPRNRTYRYNWLYDNCTTRARDAIERAVNGRIVYGYTLLDNDSDTATPSARQMLHGFASADRWVEFGQNLLLGYEIDQPLTYRQTMFLPSMFQQYASSAVIERTQISDSTANATYVVPLISAAHEVLKPETSNIHAPIDPPFTCFLLLFVAITLLSIFEIRRNKTFKWVDVIMCVPVGLAGLLISFLYFCSEHAGVSTNMLVILFNPLPLIWIPFVVRRHVTFISYVILAEFILFFLAIFTVRQHVDFAIWPLVSTLLVRVLVNIWLNRQKYLTLHSRQH